MNVGTWVSFRARVYWWRFGGRWDNSFRSRGGGGKRYIHRISVRSGRESRLMDIGVLSDAHRSVF